MKFPTGALLGLLRSGVFIKSIQAFSTLTTAAASPLAVAMTSVNTNRSVIHYCGSTAGADINANAIVSITSATALSVSVQGLNAGDPVRIAFQVVEYY